MTRISGRAGWPLPWPYSFSSSLFLPLALHHFPLHCCVHVLAISLGLFITPVVFVLPLFSPGHSFFCQLDYRGSSWPTKLKFGTNIISSLSTDISVRARVWVYLLYLCLYLYLWASASVCHNADKSTRLMHCFILHVGIAKMHSGKYFYVL